MKPPKPARTVSRALGRYQILSFQLELRTLNTTYLNTFRSYANTNVKTNPELLSKINEVIRKKTLIKDFEMAVSEFYASVREFESMEKIYPQ